MNRGPTITQKADQPMNAQVRYMYQRNSNDQGTTGQQRPDNGSNGDNTNGDNPRNKGNSSMRIFLLIIALVAVLAVGLLFLNSLGPNMNGQNVGEVPYSTFYQQVQAGNVKDATFQGQDITGDFKNAISLT